MLKRFTLRKMKLFDNIAVVIGLLFMLSQGQANSLPGTLLSDCLRCQLPANSVQCQGSCPSRYYIINHDLVPCVTSSKATATTTTVAVGISDDGDLGLINEKNISKVATTHSSIDTNTDVKAPIKPPSTVAGISLVNKTTTTTPTTTTTTRPLVCLPCHRSCETCTGSEGTHCLTCRDGFRLDTNVTNGTRRCLQTAPTTPATENSAINVAVIAGAGGGGGVAAVMMVVVIVVCLRRRRRDGGGNSGGSERLSGDELNAGVTFPPDRPPKEDPQKDDLASKPGKVEEPTYINVQAARPRPISIERGHDNVTRYVRDPTIKREKTAPSTSEEQELAALPMAPLPPGSAAMTSKRPTTTSTAHASHISEAPTQITDCKRGQGRKDPPPGSASSLSESSPSPTRSGNTSHSVAVGHEKSQAAARSKQQRGGQHPVRPVPRVDEEDTDPEDDYENLRDPETQLVSSSDSRSKGISNPAADSLFEEPEDMYENQAAVDAEVAHDHPRNIPDEQEEHPYQNIPLRNT